MSANSELLEEGGYWFNKSERVALPGVEIDERKRDGFHECEFLQALEQRPEAASYARRAIVRFVACANRPAKTDLPKNHCRTADPRANPRVS